MDKSKVQAFVDDLNALIKKHGLTLYSCKVYDQLELVTVGADEEGVTVRVDDEDGQYRVEGYV